MSFKIRRRNAENIFEFEDFLKIIHDFKQTTIDFEFDRFSFVNFVAFNQFDSHFFH